MMWAVIWLGGRWEIIAMKRDRKARHPYTRTLNEGLFPTYRHHYLFQQDSTKIHRITRVTEWLFTHDIETFECPAHRLDLNSMEHAWEIMKNNLCKYHVLRPYFYATEWAEEG